MLAVWEADDIVVFGQQIQPIIPHFRQSVY
jgi:hypothetical protein